MPYRFVVRATVVSQNCAFGDAGRFRSCPTVRPQDMLQAYHGLVTLHTRLPQDDEESRLLSLYTTHRAKEHAAAHQVLHPSHSLPLRTYLELVGDLRVIRTECNEKWRAIGAHRKKMAYEQCDILC